MSITSDDPSKRTGVSRRRFLQSGSGTIAGLGLALRVPAVHAAHGEAHGSIRIGVIGCGGRGTGAVLDAVGVASTSIYPQEGYHTEDVAEGAKLETTNVEVVALADMFSDRLDRCRRNLERVQLVVPKEFCYVGVDAYQKLLQHAEINYVILATPPHFRPEHLNAAIEAGKNVFMEKPAAVDVPGVKMVLAAGQLAEQKKLGIAAGTQRRHDPAYRETVKRLKDGAIGDFLYAKCYWNGGQIWVVDRQPHWSDLEWQIKNWNYFTWLSGDHIVEQHVHNLDVINWVLGTHPIKAVSAIGGRQVRTGERHGHVYDHFAVEYEYPNGISVFSQCRQINGCQAIVGEEIVATGGRSNCKDMIRPHGKATWKFREKHPNAYRLEHLNLMASIRAGDPLNEARAIAESTMTAIIGREAAYSGREVTWNAAMESTTRLGPQSYDFRSYPIPEVAMPGQYRFS